MYSTKQYSALTEQSIKGMSNVDNFVAMRGTPRMVYLYERKEN